MPSADSIHPPLPERLPESEVPAGWEVTGDREQSRAYVNSKENLLVYVYSDAQMECGPFGVNLERTPEHPDRAQVAATMVRASGEAGAAEPRASLWAVVKGYMELAEELDG